MLVKIFVVVETKKYVTSRTSFSVYNLTVLAVLYIVLKNSSQLVKCLKDVYYKLLQSQEMHVNVRSRMCSNYNSLCCKEFT